MLRLFRVKKAINLTKHRSIVDRIAVSERYKTKLQLDLERTERRAGEIKFLIACNDKDISHWNFWNRQADCLRKVMEKIPLLKYKK